MDLRRRPCLMRIKSLASLSATLGGCEIQCDRQAGGRDGLPRSDAGRAGVDTRPGVREHGPSSPKPTAMPARSPTSTVREMGRHAADASRLLRALANEHRLLILCLLSEGEFNVSAINDRVELSQSALSQHLAILRADGLVDTRREAQTIYYRLASGPVRALIETLHGIYCAPSKTARVAARTAAKPALRRR